MQKFNFFKNNNQQIKKRYDYGYILKLDNVKENMKTTDKFIAVLDNLSKDYVLFLKNQLPLFGIYADDNTSVRKYMVPRRPIIESYNLPNQNEFSLSSQNTDSIRNLDIKIIKSIYCDLLNLTKNLGHISQLASNNQSCFINFQNQMRIYSEIFLNIYSQISLFSNPPQCNEEYDELPQNFCQSLKIILEEFDRLLKKALRLQRGLSIINVSRQLEIFISDTQSITSNIQNIYFSKTNNC